MLITIDVAGRLYPDLLDWDTQQWLIDPSTTGKTKGRIAAGDSSHALMGLLPGTHVASFGNLWKGACETPPKMTVFDVYTEDLYRIVTEAADGIEKQTKGYYEKQLNKARQTKLADEGMASSMATTISGMTNGATDGATSGAKSGATNETMDRATERTMDGATSSATSKAMHRAMDGAMDQAMDGATNGSMDGATDQTVIEATDRATDGPNVEKLDEAMAETRDGAMEGVELMAS